MQHEKEKAAELVRMGRRASKKGMVAAQAGLKLVYDQHFGLAWKARANDNGVRGKFKVVR